MLEEYYETITSFLYFFNAQYFRKTLKILIKQVWNYFDKCLSLVWFYNTILKKNIVALVSILFIKSISLLAVQTNQNAKKNCQKAIKLYNFVGYDFPIFFTIKIIYILLECSI